MNTISQSQTPLLLTYNKSASNAAPATQAAPVETDKVEVSKKKEIDEHNFSWGDLGKGLVGAAIGGVIDGVTMTAATVPLAGKAIKNGYKALWNTPMLGKTLKWTIAPLVAIAGVASIPLSLIGGIGYGLVSGFTKAAEESPLAVPGKAIADTKEYYKHVGKYVTEGLQALGSAELPAGETPYNINIPEGLRGAATGLVTGTMDAVAGAGLGIWYGPQLGWEAAKELGKSDTVLPLKVGGEALLLPVTGLGIVAAPIVGGVYGLGKGVHDGYKEGFVAGIKNAAHDIAEAQQKLHKAAKDGF